MNRGPVLVLAALPVELAAVARRLGLRGGRGVLRGDCAGVTVIAAASGIGLERARRRACELLDTERPDAALIAGIAGGLGPDLGVGDVIVPAEVVDESGGRPFAPTLAPAAGRLDVAGRLVSARVAATTRAAKAELRQRHAADAVDMESAAVAAACAERGTPWLCVRAISDDADAELPAEMLGLTHADGRPRLGAVAAYVLRHPAHAPRLVQLGRDTRTAVGTLAERVAAIVAMLAP